MERKLSKTLFFITILLIGLISIVSIFISLLDKNPLGLDQSEITSPYLIIGLCLLVISVGIVRVTNIIIMILFFGGASFGIAASYFGTKDYEVILTAISIFGIAALMSLWRAKSYA